MKKELNVSAAGGPMAERNIEYRIRKTRGAVRYFQKKRLKHRSAFGGEVTPKIIFHRAGTQHPRPALRLLLKKAPAIFNSLACCFFD